MFKVLASTLALSALLAVSTASHAVIYTFNASLAGSKEVPPNASPATGTAILDYDDKGTPSLADDTYNFSMSVFGLTGVATGFHIHGAANTTQNGPVRVDMSGIPLAPSFPALNVGGTLLVGGNSVAAPGLLTATPVTGTNPGYAAMSFLDMLRNSLAYANVHTATFGGGEVRGQLIQVTAVPEPSTYAMLLAGLGVLGLVARRRRASQA